MRHGLVTTSADQAEPDVFSAMPVSPPVAAPPVTIPVQSREAFDRCDPARRQSRQEPMAREPGVTHPMDRQDESTGYGSPLAIMRHQAMEPVRSSALQLPKPSLSYSAGNAQTVNKWLYVITSNWQYHGWTVTAGNQYGSKARARRKPGLHGVLGPC
jgi:hypothetical protein